MSSYGYDLWNVHGMLATGIPIENRTNNPLAKYKRGFGELFAVKHPDLLAHVEIAKQDARRYVSLIDDIKNHRQNPPVHAHTTEPRISEVTFKVACTNQSALLDATTWRHQMHMRLSNSIQRTRESAHKWVERRARACHQRHR